MHDDESTHTYTPQNNNRLHEAVDVWGVSKKLDLYLRTKKAAREKAESGGGGGGGGNSSSGWGAWGGARGSTPEGASSYLDERRREEAERIRGHLDRVARPSQWQGVSTVSEGSWYSSTR